MPQAGHRGLREAIARHVGQLSDTEIAPERVVFFPGAQTALYAVCQCLLDAGDEVIVPEPTYVTYEAVLGIDGRAHRQRARCRPSGGSISIRPMSSAPSRRARGPCCSPRRTTRRAP